MRMQHVHFEQQEGARHVPRRGRHSALSRRRHQGDVAQHIKRGSVAVVESLIGSNLKKKTFVAFQDVNIFVSILHFRFCHVSGTTDRSNGSSKPLQNVGIATEFPHLLAFNKIS